MNFYFIYKRKFVFFHGFTYFSMPGTSFFWKMSIRLSVRMYVCMTEILAVVSQFANAWNFISLYILLDHDIKSC